MPAVSSRLNAHSAVLVAGLPAVRIHGPVRQPVDAAVVHGQEHLAGLNGGGHARWIARAELAAGQLAAVPLPKGRLRRRWVTSALKGRPLNLAERTFIGLCEEVGRRMP